MMEGSEFGKGLVICLVKFAEHQWRWQDQKRFYDEMRQQRPDLYTYANTVERHMNGASDHLYEIEVPPSWKRTELGRAVKELRDFGLDMGHGFTGKTWTETDIEKAYEMCRQIALLIDKKLGLKPDMGEW